MTKQEEIKRFIVRDKTLVHSPTLVCLTDECVRKAILENNESFEMLRDFKEMGTIIFCKNKPRNMPFFGIVWEELDGN